MGSEAGESVGEQDNHAGPRAVASLSISRVGSGDTVMRYGLEEEPGECGQTRKAEMATGSDESQGWISEHEASPDT